MTDNIFNVAKKMQYNRKGENAMTEGIVQELEKLLNFLEDDELRIEIIKEYDEIKKVIVSKNSNQEAHEIISENNIEFENNEETDEEALKKRIVELMLDLGLPINLKGFRYIYEAVYILYKRNEKLSQNSNKWIYVEIGNKSGEISQTVQSTIRTNIQNSWKKGSLEEQKKVFGYTREEGRKPSNSQYINSIVAYLETKK